MSVNGKVRRQITVLKFFPSIYRCLHCVVCRMNAFSCSQHSSKVLIRDIRLEFFNVFFFFLMMFCCCCFFAKKGRNKMIFTIWEGHAKIVEKMHHRCAGADKFLQGFFKNNIFKITAFFFNISLYILNTKSNFIIYV